MIQRINDDLILTALIQGGTADSVLQWFDSGAGIMALLLVVAIHAAMTARWAGRMETQIVGLKDEMPALRQARHDTANLLSSHAARLKEAEDRMGSHSQSIHRMRDQISHLTRLDDRLQNIDQRLGRIEDHIAHDRRKGG